MEPLLKCEDVSLQYDKHLAVNDVSFSVNSGEYLCILGENGSGKSTLIKAILGLKKPNSGKIIWGNTQNNQIGYLPQQTEVQKDFPASVWEVVLSGTLNISGFKVFYNKKDREIALSNMEKLEITSIKNKSYRNLSGGQQQRVLLARALCATSKVLILDEPTAGLDPLVSEELYQIINKINKTEKITIIMVSHDINNAVKYASNILYMKTKKIFYGTTEEYIASPVYKHFSGGGIYV